MRQVVVVFIDSSDPIEAKSIIGGLLEADDDARDRRYYVHATHDGRETEGQVPE